MHTIMVTGGGLVLLGLFILLSRFWTSDSGILAIAAKAFIAVWLTLAILNMWVGVRYAGYSVVEELPVLAVVFGVPAAVAAAIVRRYGAH